jgi:hypothetical protein
MLKRGDTEFTLATGRNTMVTWGLITTTLTFPAMLASMVAAPPVRPPISEEEGYSVTALAGVLYIAVEDEVKKAA